MNVTKEILLYIESNTTYIVGHDIFQGYTIGAQGVAVYQIGGVLSESGMEMVTLHIASIQQDYITAEDKLNDIWRLFTNSKGFSTTNLTVHNSIPNKYPSYIGVDEEDNHIFTASFNIYFTGE